jgi:RNA polymerase sigma factor (TIGR02999 family)
MDTAEITRLLNAHATGDRNAIDQLMPLIYDDMRRIAQNKLRGERSDHTLNTTALVHEAYLKLIKFDRINYQNSSHFFAIASQVMRNILVDYAVKQKAQKRGGKQKPVSLNEKDAAAEVDLSNVLSVHHALERLGEIDERQMRVVECRFFGGLSIEETAETLGISEPTVSRDWNMARAWLNRELAESEGGKYG